MPLLPSFAYYWLGYLFGSDIPTILLSIIEPQLRQQLAMRGLIPVGPESTERLTDILSDRQKLIQGMQAFTNAIKADEPESLIDGILALFGYPPSDDKEAKQSALQSLKVTLFPLAARFLGDEAFDSLYGSLGSKAILAKNIAQIYAPYGVSGDKALELAEAIYQAMRENPSLAQGYTPIEIAEIVKHATKAGILAPSTDVSRFVSDLFGVLKLTRLVQDTAAVEGGLNVDPTISQLKSQLGILKAQLHKVKDPREAAEIQSQIDALTNQLTALQKQKKDKLGLDKVVGQVATVMSSYPGHSPDRVAELFSSEVELRKLYPHGAFQAGLAATDAASKMPAVTQEGTGYTQLDAKLMQNASRSFLGQAIGATIRAVEKMGINEGPLYSLYQRIQQGKPLPRFSPATWVRMAMQSGLSSRQAYAILRQKSANAAVVASDPRYLRFLRTQQYHFDVAPIVERLRQRYGNDEELVKGALAEIATKWGYTNVGALDAGEVMMIMTSPLANEQALRAVEGAMERGRFVLEHQGHNRTSFGRRVIDIIKDVGKGEIDVFEALKRVLNIQDITRPGTPAHAVAEFFRRQYTTPGTFVPAEDKETESKLPEAPRIEETRPTQRSLAIRKPTAPETPSIRFDLTSRLAQTPPSRVRDLLPQLDWVQKPQPSPIEYKTDLVQDFQSQSLYRLGQKDLTTPFSPENLLS